MLTGHLQVIQVMVPNKSFYCMFLSHGLLICLKVPLGLFSLFYSILY